jgi:hypothetical protein
MSDVMTMAEIEAAFPSEWVLIGDPQTDMSQGIRAGRVLFHSKDRDELGRWANEHPSPGITALRYIDPGGPKRMRYWVSVWRLDPSPIIVSGGSSGHEAEGK